jgi:hypothetical protein
MAQIYSANTYFAVALGYVQSGNYYFTDTLARRMRPKTARGNSAL